MRRPGIIAMVVVLFGTLALTSCSSPTSVQNVTKALEAIAEHSTDQIIEVRIRVDSEVEATVFENGEAVRYTYVDGEVTKDLMPTSSSRLGFPRKPSEWDIEAILASHPEQCPEKRFIARALDDDRYLIDVECDYRWVTTVVGDHSFTEVDEWTSAEAWDRFLTEAQLLTGTSTVSEFSLNAQTGDPDLSIVAGVGYQTDGTPCARGGFGRTMDVTGTSTVPTMLCFDDYEGAPSGFSLDVVDAAQLVSTFEVAAGQAQLPLADAWHLDVRTTPLPNEFARTDPYAFAMWYTREPETAYKIALSLDGEVLHVEQYPEP